MLHAVWCGLLFCEFVSSVGLVVILYDLLVTFWITV
jgi:hypothetical protein